MSRRDLSADLPSPPARWWHRWAAWTVAIPGGVLLLAADRLNRPVSTPVATPIVLTLVGAVVVQMGRAMHHLVHDPIVDDRASPAARLRALARAADAEWMWRVQGTAAFTVLVVGIGGAAAGDAVTNYLAWRPSFPQDAAVELVVFAVSTALLLYGMGDLADLLVQGPPSWRCPPPPAARDPVRPGDRTSDASDAAEDAAGPVERPRGAPPL